MPVLIISRLCYMSVLYIPKSTPILTEERITQCNLFNALHIRIIHKIRIDIEEHRHIHCLTSIQPLLLKTKALDLAEIRCYLPRSHTVCRYPNDIILGVVCSSVERQCRLTREDSDFALLGCEFPW